MTLLDSFFDRKTKFHMHDGLETVPFLGRTHLNRTLFTVELDKVNRFPQRDSENKMDPDVAKRIWLSASRFCGG